MHLYGSYLPVTWHPFPGESIRNISSGNWSSPSIWDLGRAPGHADRVLITLETEVVFDVAMNDDQVVFRYFNSEREVRDNGGNIIIPRHFFTWSAWPACYVPMGGCRVTKDEPNGLVRMCFGYDVVTLARYPGIPPQIGPVV